ncbi:MAG TPA: carboxymuconolactone decarboxylase family protein [Terriglobales bacterium]|nr:carboxymuconolactone decarboxylase family protein [Terriglobales bacterium]
MARISLIEPAQASAEVKEIYDGKLKGKPGNIQKALAHRPAMLGNFLGFYASVGRSLDRKLYEAVYLRVSLINGCHYCTQHHIQGAKRAGLTAEQMKALEAGDYSGFGASEQVALRYAEKLTRTPDGDFSELKKYFADEQIVDLHMLIGLANLTNRVTGPMALEVEFPEEKI